MQKLKEQSRVSSRNESGFSIIELMVAMIIFLIFMGAIYGAMKIGTIQTTSATTQTDVIKNARLSLNIIGRDAVNAGFGYNLVGGYAPDNILNTRMGLPADTNASHDLVTSVMSGNDINPNTLLTAGNTDVISFVYRDVSFNGGTPIEFIGAADDAGNGVVLTARSDPSAFTETYDLFLISDGSRTALGLVTDVPTTGNTLGFSWGALDPLAINMPYTGTVDTRSKLVACNPDPPTPIIDNCMDYSLRVTAKKVIWVSYSVTADGTLVRTKYGNNTDLLADRQIDVQPIAFNVQNFQVKYLLRDGTLLDDPSSLSTTQANLNQVVQIDVTITTLVETVVNGAKVNNLVNIKSTFSTKNLSYDIG